LTHLLYILGCNVCLLGNTFHKARCNSSEQVIPIRHSYSIATSEAADSLYRPRKSKNLAKLGSGM